MPVVPASVPPVRGASRAAYPAARPVPRANRDDLGCVTWLIGSAILLGIVGLVVLAFKLDPGAFANDPDPTATTQGIVSTETIAPATATATTPPAVPTETTAPEPTPTVTTAPLTPTATVPAGTVPSLANLTREQAENTVGDTWILNVVEEFSSSISAGVVISQDPPPGENLPLGETITIVVSRGAEILSIPDVRGEDSGAAADLLTSLGFVVETVNESSNSVAAGLVIRTEPVTEAPAGSTVTLVVSSGPSDLVVVPYVYGMDVEEAIEILEDAGLNVNQVTPLSCERILQFSPNFDCDEFPDEGVVTSTLAWESEVPRGSPIDITWYDDDL
jgi:serine/threonine-protein kinase